MVNLNLLETSNMNDRVHHDFTIPNDKQHKKPKKPNNGLNMGDVKVIIDYFNKDSSISEITWKDFSIKRNTQNVYSTGEQQKFIAQPASKSSPEPIASPVKTEEDNSYHKISSPMVGTCYLAPSPDAENFAEINQKVKAGDTICLIEAMKMFNKIKADVSGTIRKRLVEDGEPVEFGQPLFEIDETGA